LGRRGCVPFGLLPDPGRDCREVDRAAGVDLQYRAVEAKWAHPAVQRGLELRVEHVIDVAWVPGGCPLGEAAFYHGGRAALTWSPGDQREPPTERVRPPHHRELTFCLRCH
jgi:hypothetical protein